MTASRYFLFFFFNDTATTEIYTLSLHDALPISTDLYVALTHGPWIATIGQSKTPLSVEFIRSSTVLELPERSMVVEDRKSTRPELQSRLHLVCRLLLEKKKTNMHKAETADQPHN